MKFFIQGVLTLLLMVSCAPEQSQEARRREESLRDFERLNKASGMFVGYLHLSEEEIVPASIDVTVEKNPTTEGEKPALSVVLRTGLFGGVAVTSKSATFDWGSNRISASFSKAKAEGGKRVSNFDDKTKSISALAESVESMLELSGRVDNGKLVDAQLLGPHLGRRKLTLEKAGQSLFDPTDQRFYTISWENEEGKQAPQAVLTLKRRAAPEPAPSSSDLPTFPGLDASVAFNALARTPQTPRRVLYDPALGTLDLNFTDSSWMRLAGFYLSRDDKTEPAAHRGVILLGSSTVRRVTITPLAKPPALLALPPGTYYGSFQGSSDALAYRTIAYLDHDGSSGTNPIDYPFPAFPQLRLEVVICNGDEPYQKTILKLDSLDYINEKALFRRQSAGSSGRNLEIKFSKDWSYLDGTYFSSEGTAGQERPKLRLKPSADVAKKGCAASK